MNNKKKVVKLNRDIKINAATCVIAAILLYVIISLINYARKEPITTYKVNKSNINNNIVLNGLVVRDEEVLKANNSGYICYYIRDGEKIEKNSTVCTVDESGQVYNVISDSDEYDDLLTTDDYNEIRSLISLYKVGYNNTAFYNAYNFQNNVNNKVLELTNEIIMQQVKGSDGQGATLSAVTSPYSGLVTYYIDGYENYNISDIKAEDFDQSTYSKETLKTGDVISAGTPVVKIIPSEEWNIVAQITNDQADSLAEKSYVRFTINNSSYYITMPFEIIRKDENCYINISLNKYLLNYLTERFVTVEIYMEEDLGLKVPASAIVEKEVYKIPLNYLSAGGNQSSSNRFNIQVMDENGEITIKQVTPVIYKTDEEYCYVDPLSFNDTDVLIDIDTNDTKAVSLLSTEKIDGVYTANRGIAEFRMVTIIKTIDDFILVQSDEELNVYDNIILDSSSVTENQIIY
ncbi:MAG: HlyD family efflux transporter periplasmic adaptor subunit [Wujia sp.]